MSFADQSLKPKIETVPETFNLISLNESEWNKLLENPELSPRMSADFLIFRDKYEVTLLLDETDFQTLHFAVRNAKTERNLRMLVIESKSANDTLRSINTVSGILAENKIEAFFQSSFSRFYIIIRQNELGRFLILLGTHFEDLC